MDNSQTEDKLPNNFDPNVDYILNPAEMMQGSKFYRGWNELKLSGKLPERRSYATGCIHADCMYVFGGSDINDGANCTIWKINIDELIQSGFTGSGKCSVEWELIETKGEKLSSVSHHCSFVRDKKFYVWGGICYDPSSDFKVFDFATREWTFERAGPDPRKSGLSMSSGMIQCPERDDHASAYDQNKDCLYIFGGYINGDKSNDLWRYNFLSSKWVLLHPGDYKDHNRNSKKIPAPRIGARMIKVGSDILVHNGHDNDNEKLLDLWKFDEAKSEWSEVS